MAWLMITWCLLTLYGGDLIVLLCRNADLNTEFRNLDNVTTARFENARALPLELARVPRLKKVEIFKSPEAKCSWFSGWVNVIVIVINIRCESAKRQVNLTVKLIMELFWNDIQKKKTNKQGREKEQPNMLFL